MGTFLLYILIVGFIILLSAPIFQKPPTPKKEETLDDKLTKTIRSIVIDELNKRLK